MSVYVIACAGLLKIGYSEDPERRVAKLFQSGSRYSAPKVAFEARGTQRLVCTIPGATKDDESVIHQSLAEFGVGCEWFVNEPAVLDFVHSFVPGSFVSRVSRPTGWAYRETPAERRGGCNYDLAWTLIEKRRAKAATA